MTDFIAEYAVALYSLAEDMNCEDTMLSQIAKVKKAFSENPDFVKVLNSPALTLEERQSCVDDVFKGAEEILLNFVKILTEKRAAHLFVKCAARFEDEYNIKHNTETVTAQTAVVLSSELRKSLKESLEKLTGKTILLQEEVCPDLLGGIKLVMRGMEIDGSVLKKLKEMRKAISAI